MNFRKIKSLFNLYLDHKKSSINFNAVSEKGKISKKAILKGASIYGNVNIDEGSRMMNGVSIKTGSEINIGKYTSINGPNTDLTGGINKINIGSFCSIARNVSMQEYYHRTDVASTYLMNLNVFKEGKKNDIHSKGDITIGNDVWIGTHCVILSGAKIGDGVIVAANSVVNKEISPYAIVAGSPAKVIGYRFSEEIIEKLIEIKWWNWSIEKIKKNKFFFQEKMTMDLINKLNTEINKN